MDNDFSSTKLLFGWSDFSDSILSTLANSLKHDAASAGPVDPMVIALLGSWGSGKSFMLNHLQRELLNTLKVEKNQQQSENTCPNLPILFNPWRYEKEPHLLIPLLHTVVAVLEGLPANDSLKKEFTSAIRALKDAALAFAAGTTVEAKIPLLAKVKFEGIKMLGEGRTRSISAKKTDEADKLVKQMEDYESIYYNLLGKLSDITRPTAHSEGQSSAAFNLVFLIDDLDRLLPEKSIEMLEAIKLFLDIPGCAFVIALDDEVVEKGIRYKYRDQLTHSAARYDAIAHSLSPEHHKAYREAQPVPPKSEVSSHAYLEKLIHLPLRLPPLNAQSPEELLKNRFPNLYTDWKDRQYHNELELLRVLGPPYNPRKLIRSLELYQFDKSLNQTRAFNQSSDLWLLRAILQVYLPRLENFIRANPSSLRRLGDWLDMTENADHTEGWRLLGDEWLGDTQGFDDLDKQLAQQIINEQQEVGYSLLKILWKFNTTGFSRLQSPLALKIIANQAGLSHTHDRLLPLDLKHFTDKLLSGDAAEVAIARKQEQFFQYRQQMDDVSGQRAGDSRERRLEETCFRYIKSVLQTGRSWSCVAPWVDDTDKQQVEDILGVLTGQSADIKADLQALMQGELIQANRAPGFCHPELSERLAAGRLLGKLDWETRGSSVEAQQDPLDEFFVHSVDDAINESADQVGSRSQRWALARYPVSNRQFNAFLCATDYANAEYWQAAPPAECPDSRGLTRALAPASEGLLPVVNISWYDAQAYCCWLSKKHRLPAEGLKYDLPNRDFRQSLTSGEALDRAALNTQGVAQALHAMANTRESGLFTLTPVTMYPSYSENLPLHDLFGNCWEWVYNPGMPAALLDDGNDSVASCAVACIGGSYQNPLETTKVRSLARSTRDMAIGFRLLKVPENYDGCVASQATTQALIL